MTAQNPKYKRKEPPIIKSDGSKREIHWKSTFDISGYGKWGRKCVMSLISHGYRVKAESLGYRMKQEDPLFNTQNIELKNPITVWNIIPNYPATGKKAGYCTCTEIKNPPRQMLINMEDAKFVIALSSHSTNIYKDILSDPAKVHKVNFPMFRGDYSPIGKTIKWKNLNEYKFKFVFVGRIDVRKNIETLIRAFKEEFGRSRNVCLLLKIYSPDYNVPLWLSLQKPTKNIFWMKDRISNMGLLYRSSNAYVCSDLGEAWGGPCTEAMLCGIPTIAPRHSGHLDYMNDKNSYLVEVEKEWRPIGRRNDNIYENLLPSDGLVKYPIIDSLKQKMREVYNEFKGLSRVEVLDHHKIREAFKVQDLVSEETVFNQLKKAFDWVEENYQ